MTITVLKPRTLGQRVRMKRMQMGLSQEDLGRISGTSQNVIAKIEKDRVRQPRCLMALAEALKVSPAWLQFGFDELDHLGADAIDFALTYESLTDEEKAALRTLLNSLKDKQ